MLPLHHITISSSIWIRTKTKGVKDPCANRYTIELFVEAVGFEPTSVSLKTRDNYRYTMLHCL